MISRKAGPSRPPLPMRAKKLASAGQQQQEVSDETTQKRFDLFSIRYSRDDANESDEEISIVRKENSPDVTSESIGEGKNECSQNVGIATLSSSGTSSILSALNNTLSFLPRSPSLNNGNEALNSEEPTEQEQSQSSVGGIVFKSSHFEQDSDTRSTSLNSDAYISNERHSNSPPAQRRHIKDNTVVHQTMSLSSLLKKEVEHRTHFGKGNGQEGRFPVELPKTTGFLASALADSSRLLMPIGLGNLGSEVTPVKQDVPVTYTEIPLYNMLLVSVLVFLYLMLPSSSFVNGFVFGGILMFFLVFALMWLLTPEMSDEEKYQRDVREHEHEMKMLQKTMKSDVLQSSKFNQQHDLEVLFLLSILSPFADL